jgi:uncharacterized protein YbjT (DUF2867 family)
MLGGAVAAAIQTRGGTARCASRASGVDVTTGVGLNDALGGIDVVVEATNGPPNRKARPVLVDGTRRLLTAETQAGVRHHVGVSIVGTDRVPMAYYRLKHEQEQVIEAGAVPWTIIRATQFHELMRQWLDGRVRPFRGLRFQPAAVREVAETIADVALGPPRRERVSVAGPKVHDAGELVRLMGRRTALIPVPGRVGQAIRAGALTDSDPDVRTSTTFERWLTT